MTLQCLCAGLETLVARRRDGGIFDNMRQASNFTTRQKSMLRSSQAQGLCRVPCGASLAALARGGRSGHNHDCQPNHIAIREL